MATNVTVVIFGYRDPDSKNCYCILFDFTKLTERFKENMVLGTYIMKCEQCKKAGEESINK